jgi:hypothetical protein
MEQELIIVILTALLAISEALAFIPAVKANGVFQLIVNGIKAVKGLFDKK